MRLTFLQTVDDVSVTAPPDIRAVIESTAPDTNEFELRMQAGELPLGVVEREVLVQATNATGDELPAVAVSVTGSVVSDVQVVPPMLTFGVRHQGERAAETVILRSRSGRAFHVADVETTSNSLRVAENGDDRFGYSVIQEIEDIGFTSSSITFHVIHEVGPHSESILVPVRYVGADAQNGQPVDRSD